MKKIAQYLWSLRFHVLIIAIGAAWFLSSIQYYNDQLDHEIYQHIRLINLLEKLNDSPKKNLIMKSNTLDETFPFRPLVAGIHDNEEIEFFADRQTMSVLYLYKGKKYCFRNLPSHVFKLLCELYNEDLPAVEILERLGVSYRRQVELYTYFMYGSLDHTPDFKDGALSPNENFRHDRQCISLSFANKKMTICGEALTQRDLDILDMICADFPDKAIAGQLDISVATLGFHKKNLLLKSNCTNKTALLKTAMRENIIN